LRGRRVDDQPLCRKCDFDLTGKPDSSIRCPECGSDVTHPRAVRIGHREKRRGWAAGAVGVMLLCLSVLTAGGVAFYREVDFNPYKPATWLAAELGSKSPMVRGSALAEFRRSATPPIPPTTATPTSTPFPAPGDQPALLAAADRVLQWQADPSRAWFTEQGDFVEQLRNVGVLDDGRFRRYLTTGVNFTFKVRGEYRIGDPFPTQIDPTWRLGSFGGPVGRWSVALRARDAGG